MRKIETIGGIPVSKSGRAGLPGGGSPDEQYELGIQLLQSASGADCFAAALYWIEAAARQGHAAAEQLLGKVA